jgi:hypothetical protein
MEINFEFVAGSRWNSSFLRLGNFLYRKNRQKTTATNKISRYFVCFEKLCPATVVMVENVVSPGKALHNHKPNYQRILKAKMVNEIKTEVRRSSNNLRAIFDSISIKPE